MTSGGIKGKVVKAVEGNEAIDVEIADGVVVEIVRAMVTELRDKDGNPMTAQVPKK